MSEQEEPPQKKPKKPSARATAAEVELRVGKVFDLLLNGACFGDIQQFAGINGWNLTESPLRVYIARATALIREHRERDRENLIAQHLAMRGRLYAIAVQNGEVRAALAILQDSATLENLYPPKQTTTAVTVSQQPQPDRTPLTDAEVDAIIKRSVGE